MDDDAVVWSVLTGLPISRVIRKPAGGERVFTLDGVRLSTSERISLEIEE